MKYEHWTRNGSEEFFRNTETGEELCCGAAANLLSLQDKQIVGLARQLQEARDCYNRAVLGLNNEGDAIGGEPARGLKHMAEDYVEFRRLIRQLVQSPLPADQVVQAIREAVDPPGPDGRAAEGAADDGAP